jgi:quercetin dioxygenase-like cupin family protein
MEITPAADRKSKLGSSDHYTGTVHVERFVEKPHRPSRTTSLSVTFEQTARTFWHTHPCGQSLLITAGSGWVQIRGEQAKEVHCGDLVWIPAKAMHWHGAKSDTAMTHIAIQEQDDSGQNAYWDKEVSDEDYAKV